MAIKLKAIHKRYSGELSTTYLPEEAGSLASWLMEAYLGTRATDLLSDRSVETIPPAMEAALNRLKQGVPIQYILGKAPFYGREFLVGPEVLIPRRETEELVHLILKSASGKMKVLDLGTGSGCIGISLALEWKEASVTALDNCPEALALARKNATLLHASLDFVLADMLAPRLPLGTLDLMVSNPPYVRNQEKALMHPNVLDHEPHGALFVPDEDPLRYYRALVRHARNHLKTGGLFYVEINEQFGAEVASLMEEAGMTAIRIYQDLQGKDRIVWGQLS